MNTEHIDDISKALEVASAFIRGETSLLCPDCGSELSLSWKDPLVNGVFCPHCKKNYPWLYWVPYRKKWIWSHSHTGLVSVHGDDTELEVPHHCTRIHSYAFSNSVVVTLRIPDSVKVIEPYACANAGRLEHVELPVGLQRIEDNTFLGCERLKSVTIPRTVTYIGKNAFAGCTALRKVRLPESLTMIDQEAFRGSGLLEVTLPRASLIGTSAFEDCADLRSADLGLMYIGKRSFANCKELRTVKLYNGLLAIGDEAFRDCSALREFHVPETVYELGKYAFAGIPKLTVQLHQSLEEQVQNYGSFQVSFQNEKFYIFDKTAKLHYCEGGVY